MGECFLEHFKESRVKKKGHKNRSIQVNSINMTVKYILGGRMGKLKEVKYLTSIWGPPWIKILRSHFSDNHTYY